MKKKFLILFTLLVSTNLFAATQYIVGYGSLMHEKSKRYTGDKVGDGVPVEVKGFKRVWGVRSHYQPGTTFLGAIKSSKKHIINGALFCVDSDEELKNFDMREKGYTRILLDNSDIKILEKNNNYDFSHAKIWIYSIKGRLLPPSYNYPIVQSYVDLYIHGCIELEKKYEIKDFANKCVNETYGWPKKWSKVWQNDRIYPRRPYIYEKYAFLIDDMLKKFQ